MEDFGCFRCNNVPNAKRQGVLPPEINFTTKFCTNELSLCVVRVSDQSYNHVLRFCRRNYVHGQILEGEFSRDPEFFFVIMANGRIEFCIGVFIKDKDLINTPLPYAEVYRVTDNFKIKKRSAEIGRLAFLASLKSKKRLEKLAYYIREITPFMTGYLYPELFYNVDYIIETTLDVLKMFRISFGFNPFSDIPAEMVNIPSKSKGFYDTFKPKLYLVNQGMIKNKFEEEVKKYDRFFKNIKTDCNIALM